MTAIKNKTILITGAGSGIGRLLAQYLALEGASALHLWDLNAEGLDETCRLIGEKTCRLLPLCIDITDNEKVYAEAERIGGNGGVVQILINNAGIIYGGLFRDQTADQITRTVTVNLSAMMQVTRAFLPQMLSGSGGHIVNVASAAGLVSNPGMAVYAASKWGTIGWSDSLRLELERTGTGLKVTTVTPYYINTGMFDGVTSNWLLPILKPEKVARCIVRGIVRNRLFVRMPRLIYITPLAKGVLPVRWFDWFAGGVLGVYHSMDHFTGHKK